MIEAMTTTRNIRSDILLSHRFNPDQLELLARNIGQSIEMLQMMVDGICEVSDEDARCIEQLLEQPTGYLDGMPQTDTTSQEHQRVSEETASYIPHTELEIAKRWAALPANKQRLVSELIEALTER